MRDAENNDCVARFNVLMLMLTARRYHIDQSKNATTFNTVFSYINVDNFLQMYVTSTKSKKVLGQNIQN